MLDPFGRSRLPDDIHGEGSPLRRVAAPGRPSSSCGVTDKPAEPTLAEVTTLLRHLSAQITDLPEAIAAALRCDRGHAARPLGREDRRTLATLLPVLWCTYESAVFAVRDLLMQARLNAELQHELEQGFGPVEDSAKLIGKFLARVEGVSSGEYRIVRAGAVREGVLWRVERL